MKNANQPATKSKKSIHHNKPKTDNKDNLDDRKNEEFDYKGDDITHNKKMVKSERKKVK